MRAIIFAVCVVALLVATPVAPAAPVSSLGARLFHDFAQGGYFELDDQAFRFVGLPLVSASRTMRRVTLVVFDAWDDAHGVLVETIAARAFPDARVVRYDYAERINGCPQDTWRAFIVCAQNYFAEMFESIVQAFGADEGGVYVVNMSFKLFSPRTIAPLLAKPGCESASDVGDDSGLRRIASTVMRSPANFIWVAAAGNDGVRELLSFPACLSRVWAVSALMRAEDYDPGSLALATYSNWAYGAVASPIGGRMEISGRMAEGTSFAAPLFAGMIATWASICSTMPETIEPQYFAHVPGAPVFGTKAIVPTVLDVRC